MISRALSPSRWRRATFVIALFAEGTAACSLRGLDAYSQGADGGTVGDGAARADHNPEAGTTPHDGSSPTKDATKGTGSDAALDVAKGKDATGDSHMISPSCDGSCGCADLSTDSHNCGQCGLVCPGAYACTEGLCGDVPVDISASGLVACVVLHGGEVWCWGRDVWGEVGLPPGTGDGHGVGNASLVSDNCENAPVKVSGITNAIAVSVGGEATCALAAGGAVYCWGSNVVGALGHDPASDTQCTKAGAPAGQTGPCSSVAQEVSLPTGVVISQLGAGGYNACAVATTGDVYCWGANSVEEVSPSPGTSVWQPTKNANRSIFGTATEVALSFTSDSSSTVCVRNTASQVYCWGTSQGNALFTATAGVTGCGSDAPCDPKAHLVSGVAAEHVQIGYLAGCGLSGGVVTCWGNDDFAQDGLGTAITSDAVLFGPTAVPKLTGMTALSMSTGSTMTVDGTGQAWALGWNSGGEAGDGMFDGTPCQYFGGSYLSTCIAKAKPSPGLTNIAKLSVGVNAGAAITTDHKVLVWGANETCNLAQASTMDDVVCPGDAGECQPTPVPVQGLP